MLNRMNETFKTKGRWINLNGIKENNGKDEEREEIWGRRPLILSFLSLLLERIVIRCRSDCVHRGVNFLAI